MRAEYSLSVSAKRKERREKKDLSADAFAAGRVFGEQGAVE